MDLYSQEIQEKKKRSTKSTPNHQKMAIGTYISIITLNVNGLNAPTKIHRLAEWIQKQDPYICCLQEIHFRPQDTYTLKVRGWKIYSMQRKSKRQLEYKSSTLEV